MIDQERKISGETFKKRLSDVFINCKKPNLQQQTQIIKERQTKLKQINFFDAPIMNGSNVTKQFQRNAQIDEVETDWSIIQDAFSRPNASADDNSTDGTIEIDVLRNETQIRKSMRLSSRQSNHSKRQSQAQIGKAITEKESIIPPPSIELFFDDEEFNRNFSLPELDLDLITPPVFFQNNNSILSLDDLKSPFGKERTPNDSEEKKEEEEEEEVDVEAIIKYNNSIASLNKDSMDFKILMKLIGLWKKNVHPIRMEHILLKRCNRIQAAKTFGALLGMYNFIFMFIVILLMKNIIHFSSQKEELHSNR